MQHSEKSDGFVNEAGDGCQLEIRGKVAENCAVCVCPRAFIVIDHYRVDSFLGFAIGTKHHLQTSIRCAKCRAERIVPKKQYPSVVPVAEKIGIEDLISKTNPSLAPLALIGNATVTDSSNIVAVLGWRNRVHGRDQNADTAIAPGEPRNGPELIELLDSIKGYENHDGEYGRLIAKLVRWNQLSFHERERLTQSVGRFIRDRNLESFLVATAQTIPPEFGQKIATITYVLCLTVLLLSVEFPFFDLGDSKHGIVLAGYVFGFLAATIAALTTGFAWAWWHVRRWFMDVLIPVGKEADVDFQAMVELLEHRTTFGKMETTKMKQLRRSRIMLFDLLEKNGLITPNI